MAGDEAGKVMWELCGCDWYLAKCGGVQPCGQDCVIVAVWTVYVEFVGFVIFTLDDESVVNELLNDLDVFECEGV